MARLRLLFQCAMVLSSSFLWISDSDYDTKAQSVDPCRQDAFADLVTVIDENFETGPDHVDLIQGWVLEDTGNGGTLHVNAPPLEINTLTELAGDIHLVELRAKIVEGGFALHFGAEGYLSHQFIAFARDFLELYIVATGDELKLVRHVQIPPRDWHSFRVIFSDHSKVQVCSDGKLVLNEEVAGNNRGEFVSLGVGSDGDVYFDDMRLASSKGETGGSLCMTASRRSMESFGDHELVNDRGETLITSFDSIRIAPTSDSTPEELQYRWYRNGVLIPDASGATLTNQEMKTFIGNPEECTPRSRHTDHTITGYTFTAEVYTNDQLISRASTAIKGPYYSADIRAITIGMWDSRLSTKVIDEILESLIDDAKANWVRIMRVFFQEDRFGGDGRILATRDEQSGLVTGSEDLFAYVVSKAHSLGLHVFYVPAVYDPGFTYAHREDPPTAKFYDIYRDFMLEQARLAGELQVELLDIAPEMENIQRNNSYFEDLVKLIRKVYSGKITFQPVACCEGTIESLFSLNWIRQLDYIGLGIIFQFEASELDQSLSKLRAYYRQRIAVARELSKKFSKPVFFTEAGFLSADGEAKGLSGQEDIGLYATADWQEQADILDALFQAIATETSWSIGIAVDFWQERADSLRFPRLANGLTLYGKFGGRVLASWYDPANEGFSTNDTIADADNDGVPDDVDYCPNYPGSPVTNGC